MITGKKIFAALSIFTVVLAIMATGCKDDEEDPIPPEQISYTLKVKDVLGITGTVTFTEISATETKIDIALVGASGTHPAHVHFNSAVETGGIAISLNAVDATGKSSTIVTKLDDNTTINYTQLLNFDGYVNVHESPSGLGVIIAQGDIGGNALTGTSKTYNLTAVGASGVTGTALFEKRKNNNTLVTVSLTGTLSGASHPMHIHLGSVLTVGGGPIAASLNNVDGATGKSYTNVRELDNNTDITYDGWLVYDGYINVHESVSNLATIICQGNIGSN